MSGKFIYTNIFYYILRILFWIIILLMFMPIGKYLSIDMLWIIPFAEVILLIVSKMLFKITGFFKADEKQVTFKTLGRKTIINYNDIEKIDIEKKSKLLIYGNYCQLKVVIKAKDKTYTFYDLIKSNMMDMPDCSDLLRLCKYIDSLRKKC